jgi:AcrR family transcriptional regulator
MNPRKSFSHLKEQERQARKELIIAAAERVFASKPFHDVHIRDIAHEASISPALIYRYFPDQQALFVEAFLQNGARIIEVLDGLHLENTRDTEGLDRLVEGFINYLTGNDLYFKMLVNFMLEGSLTPEMLERVKAMERQIFDRFDIVFRKIKPDSNLRVLSHALFASLSGILISFRNYPDKNPEELKNYMKFLGRVIRDMIAAGIESIDVSTLHH